MAPQDIARHHEEATTCWPAIRWPLDAYEAHIGDDNPAHPVDLYLAGAAGR